MDRFIVLPASGKPYILDTNRIVMKDDGQPDIVKTIGNIVQGAVARVHESFSIYPTFHRIPEWKEVDEYLKNGEEKNIYFNNTNCPTTHKGLAYHTAPHNPAIRTPLIRRQLFGNFSVPVYGNICIHVSDLRQEIFALPSLDAGAGAGTFTPCKKQLDASVKPFTFGNNALPSLRKGTGRAVLTPRKEQLNANAPSFIPGKKP